MVRIKVFPFWRKQYLFHPKATSSAAILNLYHPYNPIAKLNWWLWKKFNFYQIFFTLELSKNSKQYKILDRLIDEDIDYIWAINNGTKSIYQKTTGLIISENSNKEFFFKWGDSRPAILCIKNEITIINELENYSFVPKILQYQINENEAFYTSEIIKGVKYPILKLNKNVLKLMNEIQSIHPLHAINYSLSDKMLTSFQHGDFCPWNLILEDNTHVIKAIDWEFSGFYPKGFDVLYYIFSVEFDIKRRSKVENIMSKKYSIIDDYYKSIGIEDWKPYLKEFATICCERYCYTKEGNDFINLLNYCK
jgi:hypothetical protein